MAPESTTYVLCSLTDKLFWALFCLFLLVCWCGFRSIFFIIYFGKIKMQVIFVRSTWEIWCLGCIFKSILLALQFFFVLLISHLCLWLFKLHPYPRISCLIIIWASFFVDFRLYRMLGLQIALIYFQERVYLSVFLTAMIQFWEKFGLEVTHLLKNYVVKKYWVDWNFLVD